MAGLGVCSCKVMVFCACQQWSHSNLGSAPHHPYSDSASLLRAVGLSDTVCACCKHFGTRHSIDSMQLSSEYMAMDHHSALAVMLTNKLLQLATLATNYHRHQLQQMSVKALTQATMHDTYCRTSSPSCTSTLLWCLH